MALSERKTGSAVAQILNRTLIAAIGAASLIGLSQGASKAAYLPAISFNGSPSTSTITGGPYVLGYHFTTDFDRKIVGIGLYSSSLFDRSVGIWDFTNTQSPALVWSNGYTAVQSCEPSTYFCWFDVAGGPTLLKNVDYVVASTWGVEAFPAQLQPSQVSLINGFKLNQSANTEPGAVADLTVDLSDSNYAPIETSPGYDKGFITVNLSFEPYTPAETPAPLPLIGAAAAFGWSRKIRRRISPSS